MIVEYIQYALDLAHYEMIDDDEPFYAEIKKLPGVYATGLTLEECRNNLKNVIEGWIIISIKKGLPIPKLGTHEIKEVSEAIA